MTTEEAYDALANKVNIEFYVGPHIARIIKDGLCVKPKIKQTAVKKVVKKVVGKVSKD